jgi:predicted RND superfamily exporter protein
MRKLLSSIVSKWPIKLLTLIVIIVAAMVVFVGDVNLSTGNETLISSDTKTYIDNYEYQSTFGTDPIIIVFTADSQDELFSYGSMSILNDLYLNLSDQEGIFYINSPIALINNITQISYQNYEDGLYELSNALITMGNSLSDMSLTNETVDIDTLLSTFEQLAQAQETLSSNLTNQVSSFTDMKAVVSSEISRLQDVNSNLDPATQQDIIDSNNAVIAILTNINALYDQMILATNNQITGASETAFALSQIETQLSTMFSMLANVESNITSLSENLNMVGMQIKILADNFNMFTGTFPSSEDTLHMMLYQDDEINPFLETYMIDETTMYVSIILEESATSDDVDMIISLIKDVIDGTMYEDALISGKPVLDYDIQSSMMDSMRTMMMTAGIIMVIVLLLLFPVPARLLPLFIVLIAVVTTIGIMGLFGIPLTMVSMAVFPVLIGLGIDYSIQFHNRYFEESQGGIADEQ